MSPTSINRQLTFRWLPENQVNPNITLSQFTMDVTLSDSYSTEFYDLAYPGVIMRIRLRRQIGYHIVQVNNVYTVQLFLLRMIDDSRFQTYVPSIVFVVLAWLSLFISHESVPGMKPFFALRSNCKLSRNGKWRSCFATTTTTSFSFRGPESNSHMARPYIHGLLTFPLFCLESFLPLPPFRYLRRGQKNLFLSSLLHPGGTAKQDCKCQRSPVPQTLAGF